MSGTHVRLLALGLAATVALVAALGLGPHERGLALAAYLALLCALSLAALASVVRAELPAAGSLLGAPRRRRDAKQPPLPQLDWLDRQLRGAQYDALELHAYFRPLVRQIASAALARNHGVVLERQPQRARTLVGAHVWELIRDDRPQPERFTPGLDVEELRRVIEELEEI